MTTTPNPLFDMSKATPIQQSDQPLFDMSKAQPIGGNMLGGSTATMHAPPAPWSKPWLKEKLLNNAIYPAVDALPAIGATIGGIIGGGGGAAATLGPGAIPGAAGGAVFGGAGGEAAKQLASRALGLESPQTSEEAANKIGTSGLLQGAITAGNEGLSLLGGPMRRAAVGQYERALAPTTKINKAITQDIAPELIQRGEFGSLGGLEKKASQNIAAINPQLNTAYGQLQGAGKIQGSGTQIIADLEKLKQSYMPEGIVAQPQAVNAIEGIQNIVKQYGPDVSPNSLRRLRQIFEDPVAKAGGYAGADLSTSYTLNAQQQAADSIRGILNKNPDIGALNKEISFWLDVQRVTSQSGLRRTGQEGGLTRALSPLAGALAGAGGWAAHGTETGIAAGLGATLAGYGIQATRSPLWRTMSAVAKDRFAQALASGDVGAVTAMLSRFGVAGAQGMGDQGTQANQGNGRPSPIQPPQQ